jgi:predicted AAA+ superfamily ATPase
MFQRKLSPLNQTFFLFGPRGTGKSTWIAQHFAEASAQYDLLSTSEALRLSRRPGALYDELQGLKAGSWVIIDEVQKVPALLDEVHRLIETKKLRFVLSGSSARKLKRDGANLLAGRARTLQLFPLVSAEIGFQLEWEKQLCIGTLPIAYTGDDPELYLSSYVETYLQEEIKAEALTRNIGAFSRFLEVAARQSGQVTNVSTIARDAQVARQTVQGYFEVLVDTLIGFWLNPWKLKRSTKQVGHPKFYLFDSGVLRALSGRLPYPPLPEETGVLFETFFLNELRAYLSYSKKSYTLHFWRSHDGVEVDVLCETRSGFVAIECKSSLRWETKFNRGLDRIREELGRERTRTFGVYLGERPLVSGNVKVYPAIDFLRMVWDGDILD